MCRPRPRGLSSPFSGADVVRDGCGRICAQGTSGASGSRRKDSLGCVKFNSLELLASRGARGAARHGGGRGQSLHMSGEWGWGLAAGAAAITLWLVGLGGLGWGRVGRLLGPSRDRHTPPISSVTGTASNRVPGPGSQRWPGTAQACPQGSQGGHEKWP